MIQAKELTLNLGGKQVTLRVEQQGSRKALKLLYKLARHASPAIGAIAASGGGAGLTVEQSGIAIESVMRSLSEPDADDLIERLMESVTVNGQPLSAMFDVLFAGETKNVFKLWKFVLEVNFADFFGDLRRAVSQLQEGALSPSKSPSTSPPSGQSGALS